MYHGLRRSRNGSKLIDLLTTAVLSLCAAGFLPTAECPYLLKAEVVEAIEGGPVVVRVVVRRVGTSSPSNGLQLINYERLVAQGVRNSCEVTRPLRWGSASYGGPIIGRRGGEVDLPDEGWETFLLFHQYYRRQPIPSGSENLLISWSIRNKTEGFGRAATLLPINVLPPTPENLSAVRKRLEKCWQEAGSSAEKQDILIEMLNGTVHRELIETALSFLRSPKLSPEANGRTLAFHSWRTAPELTHHTFAQLAREFKSSVAVDVFEFWSNNPSLLPDPELRSLYQSNRLWARILTYAVFDARCEREWVAKLRQETPNLCNSAPAQEIARILKDLDDNRYAVRQRARDELFKLDETAESQVRAELKRPLSPEVRKPIESYLERLEKGDTPFLWKSAIEQLESTTTAKGKEMLELLAKGDPENFVTRQAKLALQNRNQAK